MRKWTLLLLVFTLIAIALAPIASAADPAIAQKASQQTSQQAKPIPLYVNGQPVGYKKISVKGVSENMIAVRTAAAALKLKLTWSSMAKEWTLSNASHAIQFKANTTTDEVDHQKKTLRVAPTMEKGTLYIPLRFIVESSGGSLQYYKGHIELFWVLTYDQNQLIHALVKDDAGQLKALLKDWKDLTIPVGVDGIMPYGFAIDTVAEAKAVLEAGFPVNYQDFDYAGSGIPHFGYTLLHNAVSNGKLEVVQLLLDNGADPNLTTRLTNSNALELAIDGKNNASEGFYDYMTPDHEGLVKTFEAMIALIEPLMKVKIYFKDEDGHVLLTSDDIVPGSIEVMEQPGFNGGTQYSLYFTFKDAAKWEQITTDLIGKTLSIYINHLLLAQPRVYYAMTEGNAGVSGAFSEEEIREVAHQFELAVGK
ncbi:hypothetical protein FHS18_006019 [Paenibacillus phyllosphaerae]|uniref:Copper amine oxidase-like N-terminal domain-containing protein n=1 Tax=Paenibacillus phyllosphaerae TaxID=274593 RepID=A0A7W5B4A1_9BACL|nr:stalk domain-containing protein [Paenibacillus phyllosphaerae]MBB3113904.1 hypothetical protein [Paenibacillus phyllosphaerae]